MLKQFFVRPPVRTAEWVQCHPFCHAEQGYPCWTRWWSWLRTIWWCVQVLPYLFPFFLSGLSTLAPCQEDRVWGGLHGVFPWGFPLGAGKGWDPDSCYRLSKMDWCQPVQPKDAVSYPYLTIMKERLYWFIQTREETTQMLVTKKENEPCGSL